jgi:hypothetical protein
MRVIVIICFVITGFGYNACNKKQGSSAPSTPTTKPVAIRSTYLDETLFDNTIYGARKKPLIRVIFTEPLLSTSIANAISLTDAGGSPVAFTIGLQSRDSVLLIEPSANLGSLVKYLFSISTALKSASGGNLTVAVSKVFITQIDSSRKFPLLSDNALLDLVQQQTFKYFWDYGHPVSGLARERSNEAPETVTSGGSGFGIMAIITGIHRSFISRSAGFTRMQTIVDFLKNKAQKFHGAFPHWLNGTTGAVIPFSQKDNGADLVETSYLMAGLLTARQYFNGADAAETTLRNDINTLYNNVEWDWFRNGGQNVLYWHWSPNYNWEMNLPIRGWNECLITYIMAASSTTHAVPLTVYQNGWTANGTNGFTNGSSYYNYVLPLGPSLGGPLFFSHYSFLGINPNGLSDGYANYQVQTKNHTLINYAYCKENPKGNFGYSDSCWGLTASDIANGYTASSPTNDVSVIAPTAALSSFPYTPNESMKALKFFYYVLGDKLFKEYGFIDAFSLKQLWFANSFLAIDQGPIMVMIENYRSQLIWNLLSNCPEVKNGMSKLGFTAPYL